MEKQQNKSFTVEGMTCVNCASNLEKSLKKAGLESAQVNFASKKLQLDRPMDRSAVAKLVKNAGFSVSEPETQKSLPLDLNQIGLGYCVLVSILFMVEMLPYFSLPPWAGALLALPVLAWGYKKYGKGALNSVRSGAANMYVLILLGATVAFIFSLYLWLYGSASHYYFETTAVLITIVLIGSRIEDYAIDKTAQSLDKLKSTEDKTALVQRSNGPERVAFSDILTGDVVRVNEGDIIPTDGEVLSGDGHANESLLTGESRLQSKSEGQEVLGGAVLESGSILYRVSRTYEKSTISEIRKMVEKASGQKAQIQKFADKVSAIFVPSIVAISLIWALVAYHLIGLPLDQAVIRGVTILVVSCPCAMGLATPMAIMVGLGVLSDKGIVITRAQALESFAQAEHLLLDKTGTLTTGDFEVSDVRYANGSDRTQINRLVHDLEEHSSHPIARSLVRFFESDRIEDGMEWKTIREVKGSGMWAQDTADNIYKLGAQIYTEKGEGDVNLTKNGQLLAEITLGDSLKESSREVVAYFRDKGLDMAILSGDSFDNVSAVAEDLGLDFKAGLKPDEKLESIEAYSDRGVTAMVGDGINDAPALKKSHVGISFGSASSLAALSSDIVLMREDLQTLKESHVYSGKIVKNIKQNLFWALFYNVFAVPMAAMGVFSPVVAVILMFGSDLVVIGNAWRLKWMSAQ